MALGVKKTIPKLSRHNNAKMRAEMMIWYSWYDQDAPSDDRKSLTCTILCMVTTNSLIIEISLLICIVNNFSRTLKSIIQLTSDNKLPGQRFGNSTVALTWTERFASYIYPWNENLRLFETPFLLLICIVVNNFSRILKSHYNAVVIWEHSSRLVTRMLC